MTTRPKTNKQKKVKKGIQNLKIEHSSDSTMIIEIKGTDLERINDLIFYQHLVAALNDSIEEDENGSMKVRDIKIKLKEGAFSPEKQGNKYILKCYKAEEIPAGEAKLVDTGVIVNLPEDYEIQLRSTSGTLLTHINRDYGQSIKIPMNNNSQSAIELEVGTKIGVMVFVRREPISIKEI
jgi:dUTPase